MRAFVLFALTTVAACSPADTNQAEPAPPASVAPATSSAEAEMISEEQAEAVNAAAPAPDDAAWTGRFAATPELCVQGVWDIKPHAIVTDGETACDVDNVARGAGQVTLRLSCVAEGMRSGETWTLTPGADDRLAVARNTGRETVNVDLRRCR